MNKSKRTQHRYKKANRNQKTLESFFSGCGHGVHAFIPEDAEHAVTCSESVTIRQESVEVEIPPTTREENASVDLDIEAILAIHEESADVEIPPPIQEESVDVEISDSEMTRDEDENDWEEDLDECIHADGVDIRGWEELREQITTDLKNRGNTLPITKINQLLVLRNFATLQLKGYGKIEASTEIAWQWHEGEGKHYARKIRALARHYQVFERLPVEKRGGEKASRSLLLDERVKTSARSWLTAQKVGEVTPRKFQHALNQEILPALSIMLKRPLCERTARRWILRLGWRLKTLKKGVYMDGHEREDVVKYRNEVFLPAMAKFEERMTKFEGPELRKVEPTLGEGEKEIIPQFHDESCLSVNDYKANAWLGPGQTILQKKGRGRLIHVSEFINPITGRLILHDAQGNIVDEARKIIYPGSNGDAWWDTEQLLAQVKHAIEVFEKAHPNCITLFIFDQSSAHVSLGPDALKAFDMNKSDGGKQRKQHDTVIPESNPAVEHRGKVQKMTLPDSRPKGLERVLTECGFDVHKMRAKCSPVCPFENANCCMARLLSKQDDFANQESMLETLIKKAGHECIFLPKFHCELNPIEMVRYFPS